MRDTFPFKKMFSTDNISKKILFINLAPINDTAILYIEVIKKLFLISHNRDYLIYLLITPHINNNTL